MSEMSWPEPNLARFCKWEFIQQQQMQQLDETMRLMREGSSKIVDGPEETMAMVEDVVRELYDNIQDIRSDEHGLNAHRLKAAAHDAQVLAIILDQTATKVRMEEQR